MDEEIKVSQLPEASSVGDDDLLMIIQGGLNKKAASKNIPFRGSIATVVTSTTIAQNTDYTIPLSYCVGNNSLEIYYMGERLIKGTHYIEVGTTGAVSNKIQFYNWGQAVPANRIIEFIVKGVYS